MSVLHAYYARASLTQVVTKVNEKHICSFDEVTSLVPTLLRPLTIGFDIERAAEENVVLPPQASPQLHVFPMNCSVQCLKTRFAQAPQTRFFARRSSGCTRCGRATMGRSPGRTRAAIGETA